MKLTVLTTITNPVERQDRWLEALTNYCAFADEVVVVNGGQPIVVAGELNPKIKIVELVWPFEWNWVEYPRHLNYGKTFCTGDWILRLDIDQLIHENDFFELKKRLASVPDHCEVMTLQKMSFTYGGKYYQKGGAEICVRNLPYIAFGEAFDDETDLCFPIHQKQTRVVYQDEKILYELPRGFKLKAYRSGVSYWNYDYYFRSMEVTKREFWRASRAWNRFFKNWNFGDSEERSFEIFCKMIKARHDNTPLVAKLEEHPSHIRKAIEKLPADRLGYNGWGIL